MQINEEVLKRLGFTVPGGFELQSAEIGTDLPDCADPDKDDVCVTVTMKIVEIPYAEMRNADGTIMRVRL